jgi:undecaprenyl-diphosphatase
MRMSRVLAQLLLLALFSTHAEAGLDHELPLDQNGIWARSYQTSLEYGVIATEVAGSLWFGNDNELGHTFWQTIDASSISGIAATILKETVGRPHPYQRDDPATYHAHFRAVLAARRFGWVL